jgi:hypothetical protein
MIVRGYPLTPQPLVSSKLTARPSFHSLVTHDTKVHGSYNKMMQIVKVNLREEGTRTNIVHISDSQKK